MRYEDDNLDPVEYELVKKMNATYDSDEAYELSRWLDEYRRYYKK